MTVQIQFRILIRIAGFQLQLLRCRVYLKYILVSNIVHSARVSWHIRCIYLLIEYFGWIRCYYSQYTVVFARRTKTIVKQLLSQVVR